MVGVRMCPVCRGSKVKCTPTDRIWIDGGQQDKCERCTRYGHECGPHESPPQRPRAARASNSQGSQRLSIGSQVSVEATVAPVPQRIDTPVEIRENKQELQRRLRSLDMQLEATKRLQFAVEMMVQNNRHTENLYNELLSSRNANVRILSLMPGQAEALADRLAAAGEIETAEGAYERILNAYRAYRAIDMKAIKAGHEIKSLLLKMANIFLERGDHLRAESLMWEALESRDFPSEAQESDLEVLKCLANSLPQTSNELSTAIQSAFDGRVPSHLFSPFPPLQRMMQTRYASHFRGSPFHRGEYQEASAMSDVPILGGIETVLELLRVLPVGALAARDIYGQSPLYLAASLQMEGLGRAILLRITELPGLGIQSYINARDLSGQTVLGASICGGCSLDFVRHLIDHGAEVDPEPLKQLPLTPLQAAASMGSLDIVDLLLNCGAKTDRVYRGNKTALTFAEEDRHEAIVRRLRDTSEVYSSPNTVLRLQPP